MGFEYYRQMLVQPARIKAFESHITSVVRPHDRVLEVGAGLGTFSLFAARAGADRVWAIEGGAVIEVAKSIARLNGLQDRVEFIRGWFPEVGPGERVDVAIFEDYPARLLGPGAYRILTAIHQHALKPGGRVIPDRARLLAAPVLSESVWEVVRPLDRSSDVAYGIDWSPSREYVCNEPMEADLRPEDLRGGPEVIADVSFAKAPSSADLGGEVAWRFHEATEVNGFAYWFDVEVGGGTWLSNAPGADPGSWGCLYLPLPEVWSIPVGVELRVRIAPEVAPGGEPSWLTWKVESGPRRFRGHEFKSFPAALDDLIGGPRE